jgi:hypothetical protein
MLLNLIMRLKPRVDGSDRLAYVPELPGVYNKAHMVGRPVGEGVRGGRAIPWPLEKGQSGFISPFFKGLCVVVCGVAGEPV